MLVLSVPWPWRRAVACSFIGCAAPAWAALAGALLLGVPVLRGDIQKASAGSGTPAKATRHRESPPPAPVPASAKVALDGRVEIVLEAHGGGAQEIEFLLRRPPEHGGFTGPPRQLTRNTAAVTYVHRAADGPGSDAFTFAVQVLGGEVSVAETVTVTVLDVAPELTCSPAELDFGAVPAGDTSRAEVTLENVGGGVAAGELVPPTPWEVDGPATYHLAHGQRQTFALVFRSAKAGSFSDVLRLPGHATGATVRLIGIGVAPAGTPMPTAAAATEALPSPAAPLAVPSTPAPEAAAVNSPEPVHAQPSAQVATAPALPTPGASLDATRRAHRGLARADAIMLSAAALGIGVALGIAVAVTRQRRKAPRTDLAIAPSEAPTAGRSPAKEKLAGRR